MHGKGKKSLGEQKKLNPKRKKSLSTPDFYLKIKIFLLNWLVNKLELVRQVITG